jgi:putative ABC transport system permease protein
MLKVSALHPVPLFRNGKFQKMFNLFYYVGRRHMTLRPMRAILTVIGIALGIALFVAIRIINHSTLASFTENMSAVSGKATLTISAGEAGFPEEKLETIQKVQGVQHAVPMVQGRAYFSMGQGISETLTILGVDLLKEQAVRTYKTDQEEWVDDPLVFLNQPDSIIVTHEFARAHRLEMNSQFYLATVHGKKRYTIRGMLSPEGPAKAFGGAMAIMDIDGARATFGKVGKLDRVDLVAFPFANLEELMDRLKAVLGAGYFVERPEVQSQGMEKMVASYQMILTFFSSLAFMVGLFLLANSVSVSVVERRKEIGTLRAVGATQRSILTLFLTEALAMGLLGAFLGAFLGRFMASILVKDVTQAMSSQYLTQIEVSELHFSAKEFVEALLLGGIASTLAALWPALGSATIQPLDAMRFKERSKSSSGDWVFRMAPLLGFALLAFVTLSSTLRLFKQTPFSETLNQIFSIAGAALLGPFLVLKLLEGLRPLAIRLGGPVTRLAKDNLIQNPRRTISNVLSLMIGLILVIIIACVNLSFKTTIMDWTKRVLRADLLVSSNGQVLTFSTQPLHEELRAELLEIPGLINGSQPGVYALRFIHLNYEQKSVALRAYDEPDPALHYSNIEVLDRPSESAGYEIYHNSEPTILVSENFAFHFKKKTGDFLELTTPSGAVQFKIAGVTVDYASDVGALYLDRKVYKKFWKDSLVNAFGIMVAPQFKVEQVRAEIDRRMGQAKNIVAVSNFELKKQMTQVIDDSFKATKAVEVAALLVGLLGLLNTLLISVMERIRELGTLRAVGMSSRQLFSMILQEALFQGAFGAIVSAMLGVWLAYFWINYNLSFVMGWIVHFHFPWRSIFTTILTGLGVALIAGVYPARKAAKMPIVEALDYE